MPIHIKESESLKQDGNNYKVFTKPLLYRLILLKCSILNLYNNKGPHLFIQAIVIPFLCQDVFFVVLFCHLFQLTPHPQLEMF